MPLGLPPLPDIKTLRDLAKIRRTWPPSLPIDKAPPGPKPQRFGPHVDWDDKRRRWVDTRKPGGVQPAVQDKPEMGHVPTVITPEEFEEVRKRSERFWFSDTAAVKHGSSAELDRYLSRYSYGLNKDLRDGKPLTKPKQKVVQGLMSLFSPVSKDRVVYRGISGHLKHPSGHLAQEGDLLDLDAMTSTSRDPSVAHRFGQGRVRTFMDIKIPKGAPAIIVDYRGSRAAQMSGLDREREVLVPVGQRLKIESITPNVTVGGVSVNSYVTAVVVHGEEAVDDAS